MKTKTKTISNKDIFRVIIDNGISILINYHILKPINNNKNIEVR